MTILLVLWLIAGQPTIGYQVEFSSMDKCEKARSSLIDDAHRIVKGGSPEGGALGGPGHTVIPLAPYKSQIQLSIVCAEK